MLNSEGDLAPVGCSAHRLVRQLGFAYESAHTNSAFGAATDVYSPDERSERNCSGHAIRISPLSAKFNCSE
jgi:hypothetical protein